MKKYFQYSILAAFLALFSAGHAAAQTFGCASGKLCNPLGNVNNLTEFIRRVLQVVVEIGFPIAVFFIIYSGFLFVKARGNPEEINTAKKAFMWSVIGTVVLLGAWVIAEAIGGTINQLGGRSF